MAFMLKICFSFQFWIRKGYTGPDPYSQLCQHRSVTERYLSYFKLWDINIFLVDY
jgi:hypothetical protein